MSKLEDAREILKELKVPSKQQSDICCYTLLAMVGLKKRTNWTNATNEWVRIHDIIAFIKDNYGIAYAENSRETIRKQALHQFRNAAFIEDNGRPTNSPNYRYRLTEEMLALVHTYGSKDWVAQLHSFLNEHETLINLYSTKRSLMKIPVRINGQELRSLQAITIACKRQLLKSLLHDLRIILNAFMWEIRLKKIWSRMRRDFCIWALKSHCMILCPM